MTSEEYRRTAYEADIQKGIIDLLIYNDIEYTVTDASRVWGPDGRPRKSKVNPDHPDIVCYIPIEIIGGARQFRSSDGTAVYGYPLGGQTFCVAVFIETKSNRKGSGKLSPGQVKCHARLRRLGAKICVPRSIDEVIFFFREEVGIELRAR